MDEVRQREREEVRSGEREREREREQEEQVVEEEKKRRRETYSVRRRQNLTAKEDAHMASQRLVPATLSTFSRCSLSSHYDRILL